MRGAEDRLGIVSCQGGAEENEEEGEDGGREEESEDQGEEGRRQLRGQTGRMRLVLLPGELPRSKRELPLLFLFLFLFLLLLFLLVAVAYRRGRRRGQHRPRGRQTHHHVCHLQECQEGECIQHFRHGVSDQRLEPCSQDGQQRGGMHERVCASELRWEDIHGRSGGFHGWRGDWCGGCGIGCAEGGG